MMTTDQVGVAAAEQYPVKGRLDPSTKGSLPASPPATSPKGEAHRATAEAMKPVCWLCNGTGRVEVERDRYGHPVTQVCMACVNAGRVAR